MLRETRAFLAIWHDIDLAMEADWHRWHTYEHMAERVGIPGFLGGRRYMNDAAPKHRCFTMYEGSDLSVFNSPAYLERLNAPTEWTRAMAPAFRDFMRGACRCVASAGAENGYAGSVLTVRLERTGGPENLAAAETLTQAIVGRGSGIVSAHIGICDPTVTKTETNERALRSGTGEQSLDGVVVVESYDPVALDQSAAEIEGMVAASGFGFRPAMRQTYTLAYMLRE
ncbi:hypothetical protein BAL199_18008 [alpha proteobacterium BAL199]|jgi:hypothetical protein|nr:hypothetical protein BAL199_18008 [alpha proteobacterium BAL199]